MKLPGEIIKNVLQARPGSTEIALENNKWTMIPLSIERRFGNNLNIDDEGYIVIGKGITHIKVQSKLYIGYNHLTNYQVDIFSAIDKISDGTSVQLDWSVATGVNSRINSYQGSRESVNMCITDVSEGDKIGWSMRTNGVSDTFTNIAASRNKFIVEAL